MEENIESKVNVRKSGNGYLIEVKDQFGESILPVTKEELEMIVAAGQSLLIKTND